VGQAGRVELWPTEKPLPVEQPVPWNVPLDFVPPESPRARLARKIAETIRLWLDSKEMLPSQDRAIRPGDILILVRRRDVFVDEVIRALKARTIPVAGTDRLALTQHIAVMDLMALARFVLLPEDDLTLATVLKSPFFGLTDEDLFALAHGREGSLWRALAESQAAVHARLADLVALAQHETPFEFFARVLGALGGRTQLVARLGSDAEDPIDEFLRVALEFERLHPPALQSFLFWLEAGETEVKRDMDQGRDEVRVMTVHGAKGLEAPIVILPDTCAMPHRIQRPAFLPVGGIPVWSQRKGDDPAPLAAARDTQSRAAEAEHLRLLYVALTRARDRLYICGHETSRGRDAASWHALAEAAMQRIGTPAGTAPGETILRLETPQEAPPDGRPAEHEAEALQGPRPAWLRTPAKPEPPARRTVSPSSLGEDGVAAPPVLSPRQTGPDERTRFARGRLIHRLLQTLPGLDPAGRAEVAQRFLALPRHGLSIEDQAEIADRVLQVLDRPDFAPLFAPGSRAEVPVVGRVALTTGSVPVFGIIDRLAVSPAEVLIIDYKTNRPPPARLADVPAAYLRQMAAYGALLAQVYPGRAVRCALLWTETLTLTALPPADLTAALQSARAPSLP
jgi:ATP-dependent helicase/nuclease subunit A